MNPKDLIGSKKVSTSVIPASALFHLGTALMDGAFKYGPFNWRETAVTASVYLDAAERHMRSWQEGQEEAEDSKVHHLAHAMGCMAILLDAQLHGKLADDRPRSGGEFVRLLGELNGTVKAKAEPAISFDPEVAFGIKKKCSCGGRAFEATYQRVGGVLYCGICGLDR